jgi:hypothetical protein
MKSEIGSPVRCQPSKTAARYTLPLGGKSNLCRLLVAIFSLHADIGRLLGSRLVIVSLLTLLERVGSACLVLAFGLEAVSEIDAARDRDFLPGLTFGFGDLRGSPLRAFPPVDLDKG